MSVDKIARAREAHSALVAYANTATTITDSQALSMASLFPIWPDGVNEDGQYIQNQIVQHEGQLYRIAQPTVTPQSHQTPSSEGMLAVYRPIDIGHGGTLEDPIPFVSGMAAMMASMAVGGAVGQNIAGAMSNMMGGINQQTIPGAVPPPIPVVAYHVAINGQAAGPFDMTSLTQMAASGQLASDSLVWRKGMAQWAKAGTLDDLKVLFENAMPAIPPQE